MDTRRSASEEQPDRDAARAAAEAGVDWEGLGRAIVLRYRRVLRDLGE